MKKIMALLLAALLLTGVSGCSLPGGETVYFLNNDPGAEELWQELARSYEAETDVKVKIVTVEPEEYGETLAKELEKDGAPAVFCVSGEEDAQNWEAYMLDLTDTELVRQCISREYTLQSESGAVCAVGCSVEYAGILVNKALLKAAGHSLEEITDFASLKAVVQDITARSEELRFGAFASSGGEGTAWLAEAAIGSGEETLDCFRELLELYALNATAEGTESLGRSREKALEEFSQGEAVFCIGTSQAYSSLTGEGMRPEDLAMLPLYCGGSGILLAWTDRFWAVNSQASEEDIQLALEFLSWVASSEAGLTMLQEKYGDTPFAGGKLTENVLCQGARTGKYTVVQSSGGEAGWEEALEAAAAVYCFDPNELAWTEVAQAFAAN